MQRQACQPSFMSGRLLTKINSFVSLTYNIPLTAETVFHDGTMGGAPSKTTHVRLEIRNVMLQENVLQENAQIKLTS